MSESHDESATAGASGAAAPETPAAPRHRSPSMTLPRMRARGGWGLGLAGVILVVTLVATGPLWSPLLPWADGNEPAPDIRAAPVETPPPRQPAEAAASPAVRELDRRLAALEAKPAVSPSDLAELRQELEKLQASTADLATRIAAAEKTIARPPAVDPTDIALVLAVLQIRDAIEAGRPFAASYEALIGLAGSRPEIAAAVAPLAEPAAAGLPGRSVLADRLREMADAIVREPAPPSRDTAAPEWVDQALRRLGGLVTIRRIGVTGGSQEADGRPAAAVNAAVRTLAGGDLAGAVGVLDKLSGASGEMVAPWLRMARQRLAAEAALRQLEALLTARLGGPANVEARPGPSR